MMNLISIVIPVYNKSSTLRNSILSVINQTFNNWELIIIDDGSTNEIFTEIEDLLMEDRIQFYSQDNRGVSAARNKGITLSNGKHIIFLDADDILEPTLIQDLTLNNFHNYDLITWSVVKNIDGQKQLLKPKDLGEIYNHYYVNFLAGGICYNKEILEKVDGYNENIVFGENYEMGLRICQIPDLTIKILDEFYLTYYIQEGKRTSNTFYKRFISLKEQYKSNHKVYHANKVELGKIYYFFGFLLEKLNKKIWARKFYIQAFRTSPSKVKYLIKFLLLIFEK